MVKKEEVKSEMKLETGYPQKDANEVLDSSKTNVEFAYKIALNGVKAHELPAIFGKAKEVAEVTGLESVNVAIVLSTEEIYGG